MELSTKIIIPKPEETFIVFNSPAGEEILKLVGNGDIIYKGKLVENDKKITDGLKEFLSTQGIT